MPPQSREHAQRLSQQIGRRLRHRRRALGLSQQYLARCAGISFQQLQKYEQGKNELNAFRLLAFARLLGVEVAYFFEETAEADGRGGADPVTTGIPDTRETQALARHYNTIPDAGVRESLTRMAQRLADTAPPDPTSKSTGRNS